MIEDENPPAYEPLALTADDEAIIARSNNINDDNITKPTRGQPRTITSSFRAINRLLMANGGIRANFRGFFCLLAQVFLTSVLVGIFAGAFGGIFFPVATLLASLTLVQFSTAWVHIVISEPSPLHFWQRLPPFRRTFDATWQAVAIFWFARETTRFIPLAFALLLGVQMPTSGFGEPVNMDAFDARFFVKSIFVALVALICSVFVTVPAYVVLVRVQASLLPVEQSTIIPFDRSFDGKVEPEVVGGKGYATVKDAWSTFSKSSWRRLLILYVKMFCLSLFAMSLFIACLVPQIIFIAKHSRELQ